MSEKDNTLGKNVFSPSLSMTIWKPSVDMQIKESVLDTEHFRVAMHGDIKPIIHYRRRLN